MAMWPSCCYYANMRDLFIVTVVGALLALASPALSAKKEFKCTECHTKNPKLYRMHEAAGFKDCMLCHKPGSFRFGQALGGNTPTPEQVSRWATDPVCMRCHTSP